LRSISYPQLPKSPSSSAGFLLLFERKIMNTLLQSPSPYARPKLKLLPLREQPAYRVTHNAAACGLAELLAVVIGGKQQIETAETLLARFESIRGLFQAHVSEIAAVRGIGQQTAIRIKAALALGQRLLDPAEERPSIHSPGDAAALVQHEMSLLDQEYLRVILLNTRNRVMGIEEVYHGSLNSSQIRIGEIFKPAIARMAAAIIVCHNHPSGQVDPSRDDIAITKAIVEAGKLVDIECLDHLIIGSGSRWISLKERKLGFE
jgi:DNA repair protein RadC